MKNKIILGCLLLILSACSEDYFNPSDDEIAKLEFTNEWQAGRRLFVFDPWEKPIIIEICKNYTPEISTIQSHFKYSLREGKNRRFMHFAIHDTVEKRPFLAKVPMILRNSRSATDTIYLVCRPTVTPEIQLSAYKKQIGHTINVTGSIFDTPKNQILDANLLFASCVIDSSSCSGSFGKGHTKMSYEEMESNMWEEFGIQGFGSKQIPDTKLLFSGSFEQHHETNSFRSNKYEFHYDTHFAPKMEFYMKPYVQKSEDPTVFLPYLTDEAIKLLNNPLNESVYQKYENTLEGITKLYDDYGTHVLVGGLFGGRYTYLYARKQNYYMESVANTASAELSAKASSGAVEGENWLQTYYRVMGDHKGALSGAGGDYNSEAAEHMDERSLFIVSGGNGSYNIDSWEKSINADHANLALISFCNRDSHGNVVMNSEADSYVIPLYMLACDTTRREAMKEYLDDYIKSKYKPTNERPRLVVADFLMKNAENGNKEKARTRVMKDAFGIERLYFPLVGNLYVPGDAPEGAMFESSSNHYISVGDATDQLWWVALAFEDECRPVKNICFLTTEENEKHGNKYTLRGNRADHDMNYPDIDDHYVGLDFLDKGEDPSLAITGVGLTRRGNNEYFYVIASSPGTDMLQPYTTESKQAQFHKYWGSESSYKALNAPYEIGLLNQTLKDIDDGDEKDAWFGNSGAGNSSNTIFPAFTRQPLDYPLVYQKPRQFWNSEEDPDNYTNK